MQPDSMTSTASTNDGPPDDPQDLADFMTLLLNQMGNSVDAIEVWNEPNLLLEWDGTLAGRSLLVGMAGFFAGAANTPISTIIMVSELTGHYELLLPSLWVCVL